MTLHIGLSHYLVVAALLFGLGLLCVLTLILWWVRGPGRPSEEQP